MLQALRLRSLATKHIQGSVVSDRVQPLALDAISLVPFFEPVVYFRPGLRLGGVPPVLALTAI